MTTTNLLFINLSWENEPYISYISETYPSINIYGLSSFESCISHTYFADIFITDFNSLESIYQYCIKNNINAILSDQCDFSLLLQSLLCDLLRLPGPSRNAALVSNNKFSQRQTLSNSRFFQPRFRLCASFTETVEFAKDHNFPLIVKPIDSRGSIGVSKVSNFNELEIAYLNALSSGRSSYILIYQFIDGTQFSVDGLSIPGFGNISLALGEKSLIANSDLQVAMSISYPATLPEDHYIALSSTAAGVNNILGYSWGLTHAEFIKSNQDGEFYLVESSNRGGGCHTSNVIVPYCSGISTFL